MHAAESILRRTLGNADPVRNVLGTVGWNSPQLRELETAENTAGNWIFREKNSNVDIRFHPESVGNLVIIRAASHSQIRIQVNGRDNVVFIGTSAKLRLKISIGGEENLFYSGDGTTINEANVVVGFGGRRTSVMLGEDCLISQRVEIRNSDSHAMFDVAAGDVLNLPESVIIGPHVWLGQGCRILKGASIGPGSIIGTGAIVRRGSIPRLSVCAGVPARVVRSGTSWTRRPEPTEQERQKVVDFLTRVSAP